MLAKEAILKIIFVRDIFLIEVNMFNVLEDINVAFLEITLVKEKKLLSIESIAR